METRTSEKRTGYWAPKTSDYGFICEQCGEERPEKTRGWAFKGTRWEYVCLYHGRPGSTINPGVDE